jgi:hypothetical protein
MALAAWALVESRARAWWLLLSFVPMACWRLFVATRFFADFGWHAVFPSPGDFGVPFAGLAQLMRAGVTGTQSSPEVASAIMFPMLLAAALALAVSAFVVRRSGIAAAAVGYAIVAVSLNYDKIWAHLPSGERGTFELFLLLAVLWLGGALPRWLTRTLAGFFVVLAGYTLFVSPEASMSRAALLLVR